MCVADSFANEPIPVEGLPRLDEADFTSVDPRYATPSVLGALAIAIVAAGITAAFVVQVDNPITPLLIGGAVTLIALASAVIALLERRVAAYLLREHDVSFRSGVISRQVATIPLARVQHVSVNRGPIEQALNLATLAVNSAGTDLAIPGLSPDQAELLKQFIIEHSDATSDDTTDPLDSPATEATPALPPPPTGQPLPPPPPS